MLLDTVVSQVGLGPILYSQRNEGAEEKKKKGTYLSSIIYFINEREV